MSIKQSFCPLGKRNRNRIAVLSVIFILQNFLFLENPKPNFDWRKEPTVVYPQLKSPSPSLFLVTDFL